MNESSKAKRVTLHLSNAKLAELEEVYRQVELEKPQIIARIKEMERQLEPARAELARAANLLREERELQGLSLTEMQARTGMDRTAICRLENLVEANPTIGTLERLAAGLGKRLIVALADK